MILILDNYDSFTYNLVQYIGEINPDLLVVRNNSHTVEQVLALKPSHIVVSPGPCTPSEAGISIELIQKVPVNLPLLGVCLGHQAIGQAFGGTVERAPAPRHGKTATIENNGKGLFKGLPGTFTATRYHSLIVAEKNLPDDLEITASCTDAAALENDPASMGKLIMGLKHKTRAIYGLQFHPESILTEHGKKMIQNFLSL